MKSMETKPYGSLEWFQNEYSNVIDDPWGLSWRLSQKTRYMRVLECLKAIPSTLNNILDIGCATGDFTVLLKKAYPLNTSIIGIDFVPDAIIRAKSKYPDIDFQISSVFDVGDKYQNSFDLAVCLELFYYINRENRLNALKSIRKSLKSNGYALFSSLISDAPYFQPEELTAFISNEFDVVNSKLIYLKPISTIERLFIKAEKISRKMNHKNLSLIARNILTKFPISFGNNFERIFSGFGRLAASHAIVIGRKK